MDDLEDEFDWEDVYKRLLAFTHRRLGQGLADAEEITQEALEQFFDPDYADWERADGDGFEQLLLHLGSRANGLIRNHRRKRQRRGDVPLEHDPGSGSASPEDRVVSADEARQAVDAVLELVADDELAAAVFLQMAEGMKHAGDIAKALHVEPRAVYNARRRLKPHIETVEIQLERGTR